MAKLTAEELLKQITGFPRVLLLVEKRGQSDSELLSRFIGAHEADIRATHIGLVQQDYPEAVEALGVVEYPTLILFESGKEKRRATLETLLS